MKKVVCFLATHRNRLRRDPMYILTIIHKCIHSFIHSLNKDVLSADYVRLCHSGDTELKSKSLPSKSSQSTGETHTKMTYNNTIFVVRRSLPGSDTEPLGTTVNLHGGSQRTDRTREVLPRCLQKDDCKLAWVINTQRTL